ncbi:hypothetical protein APHAL10511_003180 [Amanita phalloides]|nr:hypothetical protein APHAL10511_003180 [Amanita phalloides]
MAIIGNHKLLAIRTLAIGSFAASILLQLNAILGGAPHPYIAYGPQPYIFILFVAGQSILQVYWLMQLFPREVQEPASISLLSDEDDSDKASDATQVAGPFDIDATQLAYSPIFVLSNICLSVWSYFWSWERYAACQVTLIVNTSVQLYAVYALLHSLYNVPQENGNVRTHILSKTSTGIAILYMWKTWGIVDKTTAPAFSEKLQTTIFFLLLTLASGPDPTLGICLTCDLVAMILGPHQVPEWHTAFMYMAFIIAIVTAADCYMDARRRVGMAPRIPATETVAVPDNDGSPSSS